MRETCPECGHEFEREPGHLPGVMYVSYFMAIPILVLITLLIYWLFLPDWQLQHVSLIAAVPFLLLVPLIFRYSRIIWMHFDHP